MPAAMVCKWEETFLGVDEAIAVRHRFRLQNLQTPTFKCIECNEIVRVRREGGGIQAHFEHRRKNPNCSLSHIPLRVKKPLTQSSKLVSTKQLAELTAGGYSYIRTKNNDVKGIALRQDLNEKAPEIIVVGKGSKIENQARLLIAQNSGVPVYIKRGTNSWEHVGSYKATAYRTDVRTIAQNRGERPINRIAGILFLESTEVVSISVRGGGFADAQTRKEIEKAAVDFVTQKLQADGYLIEDKQRENCGYDLLATHGREELLYEVKGTDAFEPRFFISRNELKCSLENSSWRLAVVTEARTSPRWKVFTPDEMLEQFSFDCLAWECKMKTE